MYGAAPAPTAAPLPAAGPRTGVGVLPRVPEKECSLLNQENIFFYMDHFKF